MENDDSKSSEVTDCKKTNKNKPGRSLQKSKSVEYRRTRIPVLDKRKSKEISEGETQNKYNGGIGLVLKPKSHKNVTSPIFSVVDLSKAIMKVECQLLDKTVDNNSEVNSDLSPSKSTFLDSDKKEVLGMPRNTSTSSFEEEPPQFDDEFFEKSVLIAKYRAHSGMKFLPSPKKNIAEPFKLIGKDQPSLRRSKTEPNDFAAESSARNRKVNFNTSRASRPRSEALHLEEAKRKTGTKLKSRKSNPPLEKQKLNSITSDSLREHRPKSKKPNSSLAHQKLAEIRDTVLEEAQILPKTFAGHSGLTFKLKPSSRATRNSTFHIKPKEPKDSKKCSKTGNKANSLNSTES